ncbi:MAG: lysine--tRNA ligase [Phycisphaeraceae bacterium]|nr:MAG: lysine--tRNA ligase [Phycisphaeraceae bacterium]
MSDDRTSTTPGEGGVHRLEAQRRANRDAVRALGLDPYGRRTDGLTPIAHARDLYNPDADALFTQNAKTPGFTDPRPEVTIAGRVMLCRDNGKLLWMNLRDATGDLQVAVSQKDCDPAGFSLAKLTDLADVVVARGRLMKTRTGEITVWCTHLHPAAKSLVPPPEKHAGLADVELRYRQRYTDLWANPETLRVFTLRSAIVAGMRDWLTRRGFLEVETPMLQTLAGGAAARPFVTRMNALSIDLFMRIAPELYLKRLLVGGMPRVFEINRNFRNEGLDKQHNPEFTMLEAYEAFGDCASVMDMTESLVRAMADLVAQRTGAPGPRLPFGDLTIDYAPAFRRVPYADLFERALGFPMHHTGRARDEATSRRLAAPADLDRMDDVLVVNELFEAYAEKSIDPAVPTFITGYPAAISPLTRASESDPAISERADLFIGGMEIAPHYTELNDPDVQEQRFRQQLSTADADKDAEENTYRTLDEDFLRALKVGMPPAGGMGLGVDRLTMLLTDQRTIRDVVLFPLMRPLSHEQTPAGDDAETH